MNKILLDTGKLFIAAIFIISFTLCNKKDYLNEYQGVKFDTGKYKDWLSQYGGFYKNEKIKIQKNGQQQEGNLDWEKAFAYKRQSEYLYVPFEFSSKISSTNYGITFKLLNDSIIAAAFVTNEIQTINTLETGESYKKHIQTYYSTEGKVLNTYFVDDRKSVQQVYHKQLKRKDFANIQKISKALQNIDRSRLNSTIAASSNVGGTIASTTDMYCYTYSYRTEGSGYLDKDGVYYAISGATVFMVQCIAIPDISTPPPNSGGGNAGSGGTGGSGGNHDFEFAPGFEPDDEHEEPDCEGIKDQAKKTTDFGKTEQFKKAIDTLKKLGANGNEHAITFGMQNKQIVLSDPVTSNSPNSTIVNIGFTGAFADVHYHTNNMPPSPGDIYSLINTYTKYGHNGYDTKYVITPNGTVYAIVVYDAAAMKAFAQKYPRNEATGGFPDELNKIWVNATNIKLAANDAAIGYMMDTYTTGIAVLRMNMQGQFYKLGGKEVPDPDAPNDPNENMIVSNNCPPVK